MSIKFKFTRFAFINALLSFIPIFPVWSLFPGIVGAILIDKIIHNCELAYSIVGWTSILFIPICISLCLIHYNKIFERTEKIVKRNFRFWSLLLYIFTNTAGFIFILGTHLACEGDGQTILACIYSAPIATIVIVFFGIGLDIFKFLKT